MLVPWEDAESIPAAFELLKEEYNQNLAADPEFEMNPTVTLHLSENVSTPATSSTEPSNSGFISWDGGAVPHSANQQSIAEANTELLPCYDLEAKVEDRIRRHNSLMKSLTRFAGYSDVIETHLFRAASARKALDRATQEPDVTRRAEAIAKVFDLLTRCGEGLAEVQNELTAFEREWTSLDADEEGAPKVMRGRAKYISDVVRTKADKCRSIVAEINAEGLRALDDIQSCIAESNSVSSA
ncbi:hypothetical protein Pmar_PMAR022937 [Perkinsus marinus ATCC 50983]|uniref:Uncharacterized protein n=1 Tax=Perkinsus marinus (strain ATCC 50983 / TXsc) TaxID=423536 RepID=C5LHN5_PERM5|nr:hypothetical protein Pmar_PMAR022937 [Perkinsus marinus ATCC 50983]EER03639.1 hypothetical protein Pmar_PMAR022937 [Perkinsus marinus ATCC 50983]|eukprot:XP_002771823.1 hypothetical protein Pmar_PMAR022937 [Perkinsus marinus ATCC 50983]